VRDPHTTWGAMTVLGARSVMFLERGGENMQKLSKDIF
jgi:hypothetical protein